MIVAVKIESSGISGNAAENIGNISQPALDSKSSVIDNNQIFKAAGTQPLYSPLKTWLDKQALTGRLGNSISGRLTNSIGKK